MKVTQCLLLFLCSTGLLFSQQEINQLNAAGERHGVWKKTFPNSKQLRYEGEFVNGKETGTFKFYCEECKEQPMAVQQFHPNGNTSTMQYFTIKGKLVSEGAMKGKEREGTWVSYHKNAKEVMMREEYKNGKLHGKKTTYYPDGKVTEEISYLNGLAEGENLYYAPTGVLLKKLQYKNDLLHGPAVYYNGKGEVSIEGNYKNGKKDGLWKYYENGKVREERFPKPVKKQ